MAAVIAGPGTFKFGPLEGFVVHYSTGLTPVDETTFMPTRLCEDERLAPRMVHTWTADRAKVTCQGCLEWLHA